MPCIFRAFPDSIFPRHQLVDRALRVTIDDGSERGAQMGQWSDGIEFARLDQRRYGRPDLCPSIVSGECVLPIERNRPDGPLDAVVVGLDAAVCPRNASSMDGAIDNHLRYEGFQQVGIKIFPGL